MEKPVLTVSETVLISKFSVNKTLLNNIKIIKIMILIISDNHQYHTVLCCTYT